MSEQELKPCGDLFKAQYEYDQAMNEKFQVIWSKHSDNSKASLTKEQIALQYFKNGYEIRRIEVARSTSPEVEKLLEALDYIASDKFSGYPRDHVIAALAAYRKGRE